MRTCISWKRSSCAISTYSAPRQTAHAEDAQVFPLLQEVLGQGLIQILGDGTQRQDLTYIDNVVHANALAATCPKAAGKTFNIAEGRSRSALDVATLLKECLRTDIRVEHLEKPAPTEIKPTRVAIDRAREDLGYTPAVPFEEGCARTVAWYRQGQQGKAILPGDIPTVTEVVGAPAPAAESEFPRVRKFGLCASRGLPLQLQRWLTNFPDLVLKASTDGNKGLGNQEAKSWEVQKIAQA